VGSELLLQHDDHGIVPDVVEILLCRRNVDLLASSASVGVRRRMQRLMDVADKMDKEGEVACSAPLS
jgi:hypothetical protein